MSTVRGAADTAAVTVETAAVTADTVADTEDTEVDTVDTEVDTAGKCVVVVIVSHAVTSFVIITSVESLVAGDHQISQNRLRFGQTTLNCMLKVLLEY